MSNSNSPRSNDDAAVSATSAAGVSAQRSGRDRDRYDDRSEADRSGDAGTDLNRDDEAVVATNSTAANSTDSTPTDSTATDSNSAARTGPTGSEILAREKAKFGGMRFFLAFFGWLTATGTVVLLSALITGIAAAAGAQKTASSANGGALQTAGIVGIIALGVVLFIGYYAGGYVAARMARFSGLMQGLAVWLWAVIIAILAAIAGAIAGSSLGAFSQLNASGLPISGATATVAGISTIVVALVLSLLGALLGGLAGMRFHRRVDRFGHRA